MNKEIKSQWLEDLKSGKYKKGTGQLYSPTEDCYCSMGVLGKILNLEFDESGIYFKKDASAETSNNCSSMYPSLEIAGLTDEEMHSLYHVNDWTRDDNFENVIKYIEEEL